MSTCRLLRATAVGIIWQLRQTADAGRLERESLQEIVRSWQSVILNNRLASNQSESTVSYTLHTTETCTTLVLNHSSVVRLQWA